MTSGASYVFTYDAFGQPLSKKYNNDSGTQEYYLYTPGDERIGVQRGSWWTWSVRDESGKVLRQYRSSTTNTSAPSLWLEDFVWRDGLLLGSQRPPEMGGRRHYHLDHLGTPRLVTADNGQRISAHDYFPFGDEKTEIWQEVAAGYDREDPLKFTGHERDYAYGMGAEDGHAVDDMHARYESPTLGRFLSPDAVLGNLLRPGSWNRYAYVLNNPVNFTDPSGLETIVVHCHCDGPASSDDTFDNDFITESRAEAATLFNRVYQLASGAANATASDLLLGLGRVGSDDDDYELGQTGGDIAATLAGGLEINAGLSGNAAALIFDVTGGGAAIGVPAHAIATAVTVHGGAVTAISAWHAMSGIKQRKAGKHGTFRGRDSKRANDAAVKLVARELNLTKPEQQRLHKEIGGGDLSYAEIKAVAKAMFGR
jgi:RHS repeat-associated protein